MRMTAIEQYQFALPDVRGATSAAKTLTPASCRRYLIATNENPTSP
jgi:hypothetical protein